MLSVVAALPVVHFVIGLREGVEAALIVGIIATFLRQQGRADALKWVWAGIGLAIAICVVVAAVLQIVDEPERDLEIPGEQFSFATLIRAQADGDLQTLRNHGLPAVRIDVKDLKEL